MLYDGNFYELFASHLRKEPVAPVFIGQDGGVLTRQWLENQSARYANALVNLGCVPDDRIAVQVEKSPEALALYLACIRAGCWFLPLNTAYQRAELAQLLEDAQPRVFIGSEGTAELLAEANQPVVQTQFLTFDAIGGGTFATVATDAKAEFVTVPRSGEDVAALLYTSGTTGRPKGAMLSHRSMSYCAQTLGGLWKFSSKDVLLHALPIFHGHGLFISSNVALASGATLLFLPKFDAGVVTDRLQHATVFMGVPTFYHRLLADQRITQDHCRHMRLFTCGSAPLSAEMHREFEARTGHGIVERYGATETMILTSNPIDGERRPGSVGFPLPGVDLRIADMHDRPLPNGEIGMIQVRGQGLFSGYWRMPEQTRQEMTPEGFFRTGDLGCVGDDGYVTITGRSKDLIISGGYNVYPVEVETAINEMESVHESAVVGIPHADFGEAVVAFVVPNGDNNPTANEIMQWSKKRLANYKVPKQIFVVPELPRNTMGKVLKNELRESLTSAELRSVIRAAG